MTGECLTKSTFQMLASERYEQRYDPSVVRSRLLLAIEPFKQQDKIAIEHALHTAEEAHRKSTRVACRQASGDSQKFIVHPMRVALILIEELKVLHPEPVSAAILHDVVEDEKGRYSTFDLEKKFGRNVALMVSCVTRPAPDVHIARATQLQVYAERIAQAAKYTRIIKLAERLDNLRDLFDCGVMAERLSYIDESIETYLPIAEKTDPTLFAELATVCKQLNVLMPSRVTAE